MSKRNPGRQRRKKRGQTSKEQQRVDPREIVVWPRPPEHRCSQAKWQVTTADTARQPVEIWDTAGQIGSFPTVESALAPQLS